MSTAVGAGTRKLAGIPLRIVEPEQAAEWVCEMAVESTRPIDIHLVNAYTIALADNDDAYRSLLCKAAVNFPDGRPLAALTKHTSEPLHQVRGPSLFGNVMDKGRQWGVRHYLLGSTKETLEKLTFELRSKYPGVQIVGCYSPPFRELTRYEQETQDEAIRASGATIVWVGLGTPKQDFETQRVANSLSTVAIAVGAAFDFAAGTKKAAPIWMRRVGLEWLFRLASEPRRLWRRYSVGNLIFLRAVATGRDRT